jgi:hypothetical protein
MSKRYVIQVLDTITDENATSVAEVAPGELGEIEQGWFNVQHPSGNGDWMTRSKTTALNDAVTLVFAGETRPLRIAISRPVYSLTPVSELDVAEAVALAKQIGAHTAFEIAKYGYGEPGDDDYIAPVEMSDEDADEDYDGTDEDEDAADRAQFEVVSEKQDDSHEPVGNGECCFKHRQDYLQNLV